MQDSQQRHERACDKLCGVGGNKPLSVGLSVFAWAPLVTLASFLVCVWLVGWDEMGRDDGDGTLEW